MVKWYSKFSSNPKYEPVIVDYVRTPLGSKKGTLWRLRGDDMFIHCLKTIVKRNESKIPLTDYEDVICGCNSQIGTTALDVAKVAAIAAGLPMKVPGVSLNRQCASGMQAAIFAWQQIATLDKQCVIIGGVEAQNSYPIGADMTVVGEGNRVQTVPPNPGLVKNPEVVESTKKYSEMTGISADIAGQINSAEVMGWVWLKKSGLPKEEFRRQLDELSCLSHAKACKTWDIRAKEIAPIEVPKLDEQGKPIVDEKGQPIPGQTEITSKDEGPRDMPVDKMMSKIATLPGIVKRKSGLLTAGNSCPTTDGAAAMILTSRQYAEEHGLKIRATLESFYVTGSDTVLMLTGPIEAIPRALKRAELKLDNMDIIEINEAFSTVVWASGYELGFDYKDPRFNPCGGAIAIGHPTGMTGCRLIGTIMNQLELSQKSYGVGSLCVGLGMGIAAVVKRENA